MNDQQLDQLISAYLEDQLTDEQAKQLTDQLTSSPQAAQRFVEISFIESQVIDSLRCEQLQREKLPLQTDNLTAAIMEDMVDQQLAQPVACDSPASRDQTPDPIAILPIRGRESKKPNRHKQSTGTLLEFAGVTVYRGQRRPLLPAISWGKLTAAALVLIGVMLVLLWNFGNPQRNIGPVVVATVNRTFNAKWDQPIYAGDDLKTSQTIQLTHGFAELIFERGANVLIEAPSVFELTSDNAMRLTQGKLVASVGPQAKGFTVHTENASIVDYGTEFGVDAHQRGTVETVLFQGQVEVQRQNKKPHAMVKGQVVKVDSAGQLKTINTPLVSRYARSWASLQSRPRTSNSLIYLYQSPKSVDKGVLENSHKALIFRELRSVEVDQQIRANLIKPGIITRGKSRAIPLPERLLVDSYFVHFDPVGPVLPINKQQKNPVTIQCHATFDRPILAVITSTNWLHRTDKIFGNATTIYPVTGAARGVFDSSLPERVVLSDDRRTLTFTMAAYTHIDQIRILVEAE